MGYVCSFGLFQKILGLFYSGRRGNRGWGTLKYYYNTWLEKNEGNLLNSR